jgi:cytochrome oxidase Cu insertion factor (SCO1/SenC/PrrC family)
MRKEVRFLAIVTLLLVMSGPAILPAAPALGPIDGEGLAPTDLERVKVGDVAPDFTLEAEDGTPITLSRFREKKAVVLVFYRGRW